MLTLLTWDFFVGEEKMTQLEQTQTIAVYGLSKSFQGEDQTVHAVRNVSFSVAKGEVYGLIGLSGAGKSTLIRCLNLLEQPDEGEIYFDGQNLCQLSAKDLLKARQEIGMIFQHFNLFEQKTVAENIAFPLHLQGWAKADIEQRVNELLSYIDLEEKRNSYPSSLSGGQKQRVAIARALAPKPKLLLSDEGTSALDPETTQSILSLLRQIVQDTGISIVLITHQMEVAKSICDRLAIMENGELVEENSVENLFLKPKKERTRRFLQTLQSEFNTPPLSQPSAEELGELKALHHQGTIYRLGFSKQTVQRPVVSELIRHFDIDVNLLSGNVTFVKTQQLGYLCIQLKGDELAIQKALAWLESLHIDVEVIE